MYDHLLALAHWRGEKLEKKGRWSASFSLIWNVNNLDLLHVLQMMELLVPPYFGWTMQFNPKLFELVVVGLD